MSTGIGRLDAVFERARSEQRAALVGYLPAGYPDAQGSADALRALVTSGVDIVEVGVPYTDPLIDGPVIQRAAETALRSGFRVKDTFAAVRAVTEAGGVAVVMSYWNPILRYGVERFAAELAEAGGSGLITPDLIPDEGGAWIAAADRNDLAPIFLVAPSSSDQRIAATAAASRGFVYAASTMGVTGVRGTVPSSARDLVTRIARVTAQAGAGAGLPVGVGLGVSTGAQAAEVAGFADAVIVGSALVRALGSDPEGGRLTTLVEELAGGVRRPTDARNGG